MFAKYDRVRQTDGHVDRQHNLIKFKDEKIKGLRYYIIQTL